MNRASHTIEVTSLNVYQIYYFSNVDFSKELSQVRQGQNAGLSFLIMYIKLETTTLEESRDIEKNITWQRFLNRLCVSVCVANLCLPETIEPLLSMCPIGLLAVCCCGVKLHVRVLIGQVHTLTLWQM